jgi:hypothetical protein
MPVLLFAQSRRELEKSACADVYNILSILFVDREMDNMRLLRPSFDDVPMVGEKQAWLRIGSVATRMESRGGGGFAGAPRAGVRY